MYDPHAALDSIDAHAGAVMMYFSVAAGLSFVYFLLAFRISITQKVYVVPFTGAALFFWHDLSFVLNHDLWFHVYDHWWLKLWWRALIGTTALEAVMIWQVYLYGQHETWPRLSRPAYAALLLLGTLGVGAVWWLVKAALADELYFVTFLVTAVFSVPFHTGLMVQRQSSRGQSVIMQAATIVIMWCVAGVLLQADPVFRSLPVALFLTTFTLWPLVNIGLILWLRRLEGRAGAASLGAAVA